MSPISIFADLPPAIRIVVIVAVALLGHFLVQFARSSAERILARAGDPTLAAKVAVARRYPKFATITSLVVSALTFLIYFGAVGLILHEVFPRLNLAAYLATASVMGLAVAFGIGRRPTGGPRPETGFSPHPWVRPLKPNPSSGYRSVRVRPQRITG